MGWQVVGITFRVDVADRYVERHREMNMQQTGRQMDRQTDRQLEIMARHPVLYTDLRLG